MEKRVASVDKLHMLVMLLIMYQHVNGPYPLYILLFHMPVFFIITGFTFALMLMGGYKPIVNIVIAIVGAILLVVFCHLDYTPFYNVSE